MTQITKPIFDAAMEKGWETLGYGRGFYCNPFKTGDCGCAIGAAASALGVDNSALAQELTDLDVHHLIAEASDRAGSKQAAIKAVKAIEW